MTQETDITIDFPFNRYEHDNVDELAAFWDSEKTVRWFESRGYTLYKSFAQCGTPMPSTIPRLPISKDGNGQFPYATYDGKAKANEERDIVPLRAWDPAGKVVFAQDSQNRHVAIKLICSDSDEHRILEFLRQQPLEVLRDNCVIPILDILPINGFCFAIMPRWGDTVYHPLHATMGEILQMMHEMLKGLNFLHQNNIVHGDVRLVNFLTDDFGDFMLNDDKFRRGRRARGHVKYAIYDFDFSMKVPRHIDRRNYWIDNATAWGSFNVTLDIAQGEFEYNPFITDVGALGVMFSHRYQHLIPGMHILAPFLDKLTTHRLHERFTTSEALKFFDDFYAQLSEEELKKPTWEKGPEDYVLYYEYDRWKSVSLEFAERWAHYREPFVSWKTRLLRKICQYVWVAHQVEKIRWGIAQIFNFWHTPSFWRKAI